MAAMGQPESDDRLAKIAAERTAFSRQRLYFIAGAALGVAAIAAFMSWNARRYIDCDDLFTRSNRISLHSPAACKWRGAELTVSLPKEALPRYSGPIRQLIEGQPQVTVKGYVLDRTDPGRGAEPDKGHEVWRTYQCLVPPRSAIELVVLEQEDVIFVDVVHRNFGLLDAFRSKEP